MMQHLQRRIALSFCLGLAAATAASSCAAAQTAEQAWLRYQPLKKRLSVPMRVEVRGQSRIERSAASELVRGLRSLAGESSPEVGPGSIVLATVDEIGRDQRKSIVPVLELDEFLISWSQHQSLRELDIVGGSDRGLLYGVLALLRHLAEGADMSRAMVRESPAMPIRWVDQWDNADGSIERGYAGRSIFFEGGKVRDDLKPVEEYARLLASIGINGCNVNNVNNAAPFLRPEMIQGLARAASAMRPWGVRLAMSVDVASPQKIGGLSTYDPLDPAVKAWWNEKVNAIYALIPDFAGFTVKADSEGQPGPASYSRTPADAANTLAAALAPHGGVVLYRAFVYNHHLDWTDPKADRARAAYDIFHPLDGKFAPNVIVQTKEGPIDFQVREPVSPLFGGLTETSQAMELQITQEYTGQQRHLVYLAPIWKQVLDFDMHVDGSTTPVQKIISQKNGGMVGVSGIGRDAWLGSPLAMANLYAFGRLTWDPNLAPDEIATEWTNQTFGNDPQVVRTVVKMLMQSWPAYEDYTGPLGLQTLTDITGSHYGPGIEGSENNGWGQWHRADHEGVGMDRSVATGTGFAGQYPPGIAKIYETAATTPDDLLLFFHHVPYTYKLHDGKTVIQYLYDSHYAGAAHADEFVHDWQSLKGRIDPALYQNMLPRLEYQAGHAIVWRDAIVQYFFKLSGISDEQGRAGNFPGRMEAEDAKLNGYQIIDVKPWEDASRGKAVTCEGIASAGFPTTGPRPWGDSSAAYKTNSIGSVSGHDFSRADKAPNLNWALAPVGVLTCAAEWTYSGAPGRFDIAAQYFDLQGGSAKFALKVNDQPAGQQSNWAADAILPTRRPHGDNSTRHIVSEVPLKPGDTIRLECTPDTSDPAAFDYIELMPATTDPH
jgi:alpha-glucuronidase